MAAEKDSDTDEVLIGVGTTRSDSTGGELTFPGVVDIRLPALFAKGHQLPPFPVVKKRLEALDFSKSRIPEETNVSEIFDKVADIIAETSEIDRDTITPESHTIDDLGIDSLDFLDIVFAIDKEFGIKIPLEKWTQEVNDGKAATEEYFVMKNLCGKIGELIEAKSA